MTTKKIPAPDRNIYWRDIPKDMPVYDIGTMYVAGLDGDQKVAFWMGHEATQAQLALKKRAALTASGDEPKTYRIVRMFKDPNKPKRRVRGKSGLTLEQAQAHCKRPDTKGEGWFDGFEEE